MSVSPEDRQQRIEDCRELYLKFGGEQHELIERKMRSMGHTDFHRRSLYRRFERGTCKSGWIERFGWDRLLNAQRAGRGDAEAVSVPGAVATGDLSGSTAPVTTVPGTDTRHIPSTDSIDSTHSTNFDES